MVSGDLRSLERLAGRIRHSQMLASVEPFWNAVRPTYNRLLRIAGRGAVVRRINSDAKLKLLVNHRETPNEWEPEVWHDLMARLKPGDVFVDVGAHIGLYALAAAQRVGPSGRVHAFEPDPRTLGSLRSHTRMNGVSEIVQIDGSAVGDTIGRIGFDAAGGLQSSVATQSSLAKVSVPLTTLDHALPDTDVAILKVDVEGYEAHVLRGAQSLLGDASRAPESIYLEMHPYAWPQLGTSFEAIRAFLDGFGYRLTNVDGSPVRGITEWSEVVARRPSNAV